MIFLKRISRAIEYLLFKSSVVSYFILAISLVITFLVWFQWNKYENLESRNRYSQYILLEKEKIDLRIQTFLTNLYAIDATAESFNIHESQYQWNQYINNLQLFERYNSIQSVSIYKQNASEELTLVLEKFRFEPISSKKIQFSKKQILDSKAFWNSKRAFGFFLDNKTNSDLYLFIQNHSSKSREKLFFSFQINLKQLVQELFGDSINENYNIDSAGYTEIMGIDIAGAKHNIYFLINKDYKKYVSSIENIFLISGILFSLIIFIMINFLTRSREKALNLADQMTLEYKDAKLEAENATEAKSAFLARMSHEIRTPLNAIIGIADLLQETKLDSKQVEYANMFLTSSEMLLSIVNDVLDISKIESGNLEIEKISFDIREILNQSILIFKGKAEKKGLTIDLEVEAEVDEVYLGDPTRIKQILVNLLGNAIKFTTTGGIVLSVSTVVSENTRSPVLRFQVRDSGIGIQEDKLSVIFESFAQEDSSISRNYGGTGLGLSISKKLCELMKGEIYAENNRDCGSSFIFLLPIEVAEKPQKTKSLESLTEFATGSESKTTILLAEDSPENIMLLKAFLKNEPYEIEVVENGKEALLAATSGNKYDIILMDIEMPELDGLTATKKIREWELHNKSPKVKIIALTAHALSDFQKKSELAGCDGYLSKPIRKKNLIEFLRNEIV